MDARQLAKEHWDAIVVGSGMGGATLGFALARTGRRVLFCEKGKSRLLNSQAVRGVYAEMLFRRAEVPRTHHRDILGNSGRNADEWQDRSVARPRTFIPFIGCGTGGSSALYGMAMERLFPIDFTPAQFYPDAEASTLPEKWPISYADLEPFYSEAELLYRVHGTRDPLREAPGLSPLAKAPAFSKSGIELRDFFISKGLHPYRLPLACEFVPDCQCCQGYLCPRDCKNDSARICLQPAVSQYGATLLDECEVVRLEASAKEVTTVICAWRGQEIRLRGDIVALAAGALESPTILLRSSSASWPRGLANNSGFVGRNLMRHHVDLYLLSPHSDMGSDAPQKEIAFNDFYANGEKFGTVQSFGPLPPARMLSASLGEDLRYSRVPLAGSLFRLVKPIVTRGLKALLSGRVALGTIIEDLPYADNRVTPLPIARRHGAPRVALNYTLSAHAAGRIARFRAIMAELLRPYRFILIKQAENNQMLAHACGTCRFGDDPRTSVLDATNRAHGMENLYIVDSSFFPSSTGTNPSLTIAANALRVAAHITGQDK